MADILNVPLVTVNTTEGAAFGAALLAGVAAGQYATVEEACQASIKITGSTTPGAASAIYPAYYERYRALYPALASEFQAIAKL